MHLPLLRRFLVTGGAGFIGSAFIRYGLQKVSFCEKIVNLDALTYAADLRNLSEVENDSRYCFVQGNICDQELVEQICLKHNIDVIVHFAAESHVDRSIFRPLTFYETNVGGTLSLLEVLRRHPHIHFHHISTDEVFGSLEKGGSFNEASPYRPNSPYAASKAASDHFVRAYAHTYGLSISISHCTNNYGPGQNVEKFIPRMIACCLNDEPFPIYGSGQQVRDWIFVDDHSAAVWQIIEKSPAGKMYGIGGECERKNIDLLHHLIDEFALVKQIDSSELKKRITHVADRPGHDVRYAIDCQKIKNEIGWKQQYDMSFGLRKTLTWYLENPERLQSL